MKQETCCIFLKNCTLFAVHLFVPSIFTYNIICMAKNGPNEIELTEIR